MPPVAGRYPGNELSFEARLRRTGDYLGIDVLYVGAREK
jgi:hypothetical protein